MPALKIPSREKTRASQGVQGPTKCSSGDVGGDVDEDPRRAVRNQIPRQQGGRGGRSDGGGGAADLACDATKRASEPREGKEREPQKGRAENPCLSKGNRRTTEPRRPRRQPARESRVAPSRRKNKSYRTRTRVQRIAGVVVVLVVVLRKLQGY